MVLPKLDRQAVAADLVASMAEVVQGAIQQVGDAKRHRATNDGRRSVADDTERNDWERKLSNKLFAKSWKDRTDRYTDYLTEHLFVSKPVDGADTDAMDIDAGEAGTATASGAVASHQKTSQKPTIQPEAQFGDHVEQVKEKLLEYRRLQDQAKHLSKQLEVARDCKQQLLDAERSLRTKFGVPGAGSSEDCVTMQSKIGQVTMFVDKLT